LRDSLEAAACASLDPHELPPSTDEASVGARGARMAARFTNALTSVAAPMPSTRYPSPGRDPPGRAGKLMLSWAKIRWNYVCHSPSARDK